MRWQGRWCRSRGTSVYDGYDYELLTPARLRSSIALIPQQPFFISGTVRDNLLLGMSHCSEEQLDKVAELAGLALVFSNTGSGLNMDIGEGGRHLSGAQKQAISIARALLRDTPVLVFDEPTNGLDSALQRHFMKTMKSFNQNRALIIFTHSTSLVGMVDRVVLMDNGSIVADDKRETVMKRLAA